MCFPKCSLGGSLKQDDFAIDALMFPHEFELKSSRLGSRTFAVPKRLERLKLSTTPIVFDQK